MTAHQLASAGWRKSTYSNGTNGGGCVEVAPLTAAIGLRDSKNPTGPALVLDAPGWSAFVTAARR